MLLYLSGKSLVSPKDRPPYNSQLPERVNERLKLWEASLPIDPVQKKKLSLYDDVQVASCMTAFLDLHFSAFSGTQTFSPARTLKSGIQSGLGILEYVASVLHVHREAGPARDMLHSLTLGMVPLSCDVMMEFAHTQLLKFVLGDQDYSHTCTRGRVSKCLQVLRLPEMRQCELVGVVLADLFRLLMVMLNDLAEEGKLELFYFSQQQDTSEWREGGREGGRQEREGGREGGRAGEGRRGTEGEREGRRGWRS